MDLKELLKWGAMFLGVVGLIELIVGAWAIEARYYGIIIRGIVGDGPKLAIAAGLFLMVVAVASFFAKFDQKMHLLVISAFLVLALILSIAAMSVAVSDGSHGFGHYSDDVHKRLKAVAGISGFSAAINLLVIGNAALVMKG